MFDAIGRGGRVKALSPLRWVPGYGGAFALATLVVLMSELLRVQSPPPVLQQEVGPKTYQVYMPGPKKSAPQLQTPVGPIIRHEQGRISRHVVQKPIEAPAAVAEPDSSAPLAAAAEGPEAPDSLPEIGPGIFSGDGSGSELVAMAPAAIRTIDFDDVRIESRCRLRYPPLARRAHLSGDVLVEVTCAPDGTVREITWISGDLVFRDAVEDCLRESRYAPQPIPFRFRQPFRFSVQ